MRPDEGQTQDENEQEIDRHNWPSNEDLWLDSRMEEWGMEQLRRLR